MKNENHSFLFLAIIFSLFIVSCAGVGNSDSKNTHKLQSAAEIYYAYDKSYVEIDRYRSGTNEFVVILGHKTVLGQLAWAVYDVFVDARDNDYIELKAFYVLDKENLTIENVFDKSTISLPLQ